MKKVTWIMMSLFLMLPLSASAADSTTADKSGMVSYVSQVNRTGPWSSVKTQYADGKASLELTKSDTTYYLFSNKAQMIIDGTVSDLILTDTFRGSQEFRAQYDSYGVFEFSPAQIAQIKDAQNVSLVVTFKNSSPISWKVPGKVLNEWKEILTKI